MLYDRKRDLPATSIAMLKAAEYIRKHGWCQRVTVNHLGQICLAMALMHARNSIGVMEDPLTILHNKLGRSPISWNDTTGRTVEEVLSLLETTAWEVLDGQSL